MSTNGSAQLLDDLPPIMKERALWARHLILDHPDLVHVDEDEQVAWVFKEEDKVWYSIDGHYSGSSPEEKMAKRQERKEKQKAYEDQVRREWVDRDEYGKLRQRVLERDNHTCQNCGAKKPSKFHTHHIDKRREGGPDTMDNLITVCPPCHKVVEGIAGEDWS